MKKYMRGFTLMELLVVVAIIGILSAITFPRLEAARVKGRDAKRISDVTQLSVALEAYFQEYGQYPTTLSGIIGNPDDKFISEIPADPKGGSYSYSPLDAEESGLCTGFHLGTSLETSNHGSLSDDADFNSTAAVRCAGSGFSGADSGKCTASDAGVACYDIVRQ
jgi:type II secretion system protein G